MFLDKRVIPDIYQTVVVLSTRVKEPNETDWKKLAIMEKLLNGTNKKYLTLIADDLKVIKGYVGAMFSVNPDFKSHTGVVITM